jgi:hypothetical protein
VWALLGGVLVLVLVMVMVMVMVMVIAVMAVAALGLKVLEGAERLSVRKADDTDGAVSQEECFGDGRLWLIWAKI